LPQHCRRSSPQQHRQQTTSTPRHILPKITFCETEADEITQHTSHRHRTRLRNATLRNVPVVLVEYPAALAGLLVAQSEIRRQ